jgi:hypothetical protein
MHPKIHVRKIMNIFVCLRALSACQIFAVARFGIRLLHCTPTSTFLTNCARTASIFGVMEAPVFKPTVEEFADPIAFIKKIQPLVEATGICRIVPPKPWDRNCFFKNVNPDEFSFMTKQQSVHQMVNRAGPNVIFVKELVAFWRNIKKSPLRQMPQVDGQPVDLYKLHLEVEKRGGIGKVRLGSAPAFSTFAVILFIFHANHSYSFHYNQFCS